MLMDDSPMIAHSVFQTAESVHFCMDLLMIQNPIATDSHSILAQNPWIHDHIPAGFWHITHYGWITFRLDYGIDHDCV